jgi:TonB dependent receptor/CarboxypepD_reg-like domain/TonB-dependent Receptor Plug Domain
MNLRCIIFSILVFITCTSGKAQNSFTLSGTVKDASTGESLLGAIVQCTELSKGTSANVYGFYSLSLPRGKHTLTASLLGYKTESFVIELTQNTELSWELVPAGIETNEVTIESGRSDNTRSTDIGKIGLEMNQVKTLPVLLGEVDILKTITLLPGVKSSGEGNAGFYVRGGGVDQNLVLLDNATVYNASHLFGFFSVFNGDAVKNLELTKGGIPANYGSRLASVLDINLKEGNQRQFHAEGGIGTIASRLTIEGPIKKDTSSFIISARRTYIDALLKPFIKPTANAYGSGYYFYDLNAKVNWKLSTKDQLFLSGYFGKDVFTFNSKKTNFSTRIPWGNATGTLRWNRVINPKLFMNSILTLTDYKFSFGAVQEGFEFTLSSGIRDMGAKVQWSYYPNYRHRVKFGIDYTHHDFMPNSVYARSGDTEFDTGGKVHLTSHEAAAYALDEFDITENLSINAGLRYSYFAHVGPFTRYIKSESGPLASNVSTSTITYDKGSLVQDYGGFEPRVNIRWSVSRTASIKAGYMKNYQYIHLTSLSPTSLPTDVWLPSTDLLKPQIGQQGSVGYFRNFGNNDWESSVEVYYKTMQNQSEYKQGVQPDQTVNDNIDNLLVFGSGRSYGAEFFLKKATGKLNGWIGYTWSKTYRIFQTLNDGKPFPTRWDRRHDLSFVMNYKIHPRLDLGFVFVYATGNAITLPVERYFYENRVIDVYGSRNGYRMAPYHRADFSATWRSKQRSTKPGADPQEPKRKTRYSGSWNFSVYNLYNRRNPYFIYFGTEGQLQEGVFQVKAYQVSLFPMLPSITWNFEF